MSMPSFLLPSYWLTMNPPNVWQGFGRFTVLIFLVLLVAGVVARMRKQTALDRYTVELYRRLASLCLTMGFLGLLLFFLSYEQTQLLGSRFFYLVWFIGLIVWSVSLVRYLQKDIPAKRLQEQERLAREKYLPKRRK
jgi:peptidoglycan/LPS O-acetylase OafA/YrhL